MLNKKVYSLLLAVAVGWAVYFFSETASGSGEKSYLPAVARHTADTIGADTLGKSRKTKDSLFLSQVELNNCYVIDSFFKAMNYRQRFNGNVLIAHNGKVLFSGSFGFANYKKKTELTDSSEFQLGSVSKQFTATAIMKLEEQGKLKFDDSIQQFYPDFPYHGITVRELLDHRSGLPNYMYLCSSVNKDENGFIDNQQVVDYLTRYHPSRYFRPDLRFNYSNTNYCLLAAIVEKISGESFSQFMTDHFFQPLGMKHTFIYDKTDTVIPNRVQGYNANYNRSGIDFLDGVTGDKGVYSTTADMLKWDQALYTNQVINQKTLKQAFAPHGRWMRQRNYGYGWWLMPFGDDTLTYHDGWWHGFNCAFIRDVKYHNTIIVLSNHVNWCINKSRELLYVLRATLKESSGPADLSTDNTQGTEGNTHSVKNGSD